MASYDLDRRRARYFTLSSALAHLDNAQLRARFAATEAPGGWGRTHVLAIGRAKVFVKRLPVTDRELDNLFSTKNLYDLPPYYNYGVGSAGFGVFRELVANIKTTNWVLAGAIAHFPLLYHYRMLPIMGERPPLDMERHRGYVAYWNGNANIGRFVLDRANANYELALFFEHLPYAVEPWLRANPHKLPQVLDDLRTAITFLRSQGMVHFDAHFDNVLSDGTHAYLTDFGLVLDQRFDLTKDEAVFLKQHRDYDYGEVLGSVGFLLYGVYHTLSDRDKQQVREKLGVADGTHPDELAPRLMHRLGELCADGLLQVDPTLLATMEHYRSIILLYLEFFAEMRSNPRKDTAFPHAKLTRLLRETRFLSDTIARRSVRRRTR